MDQKALIQKRTELRAKAIEILDKRAGIILDLVSNQPSALISATGEHERKQKEMIANELSHKLKWVTGLIIAASVILEHQYGMENSPTADCILNGAPTLISFIPDAINAIMTSTDKLLPESAREMGIITLFGEFDAFYKADPYARVT